MRTIICQSLQSFMDICNNDLANGCHVHCTFRIPEGEPTFNWMQQFFRERGGQKLTVTPFLQESEFGY